MATLFDDLGLPTPAPEPAAATPSAQVAALVADLNAEQRAAVEHRGSPLLIVAGAGSGQDPGAHPAHRAPARHRRRAPRRDHGDHVHQQGRGRDARARGRARRPARPHDVGVDLPLRLRAHPAPRGAAARLSSSSFSIYDATDSLRLMTLVCRDLDLDPKRYPPRAFSAQVSNLKNELIDHETFAGRAINHQEKTLAEAYTDYQTRLRRANAVDFDDLISSTVAVLQLFPDVAEHYHRRFRHVLVDEYQDTNHAQYVLVNELVGRGDGGVPPAELCVVGDADQSIYAFRGATIRNIEEFERDYPDATTVLLEQNYRSTQTILSAANAVITRNTSRRAKRLWTDAGDGPQIIGYVADNEHDEASFVATEIDRLSDEEGVPARDVAVFYRTNAQSRSLEEVFIRVGMPYKVVGGVRFYERKEIRDAVAYLRCLANPDDDISLRRILNTPRRGIGDRAEGCVEALAQRERISFGAALARAEEAPGDRHAVAEPDPAVRPADERPAHAGRGRRRAGHRPGRGARADRLPRRARGLRRPAGRDPRREPRRARVGGAGVRDRPARRLARRLPRARVAGRRLRRHPRCRGARRRRHPHDPAHGEGARVPRRLPHRARGRRLPAHALAGRHPRARGGASPGVRRHHARPAAALRLARGRALGLGRTVVQPAQPVPRRAARRARALEPHRPDLVGGAAHLERGLRLGTLAARRRHAPRAKSPGNREVVSLSAGDRVTHDKFGLGTVVSTSGMGEKAEATIDFGAEGTKRLLLRYAPVEKL